METENTGPDFYCCFTVPEALETIREVEANFSALYGIPKTLEELGLDWVILASYEIEPISEEI